MTVIFASMGIIMLLINLNGYKSIFRNQKQKQADLNENMNVIDRSGVGMGGVRVALLIIGLIPLSFYFFAAKVFISDSLLLAYAVLQFLLSFINIVRGWIYTYDRKVHKTEKLTIMLHPVNTVFIMYFLYTIFNQ
ncbi:hypothetical protein GRF59_14500 [Paenibacillus sp. HJL G12]|uniref:DUF4181 domain-containing protein n=1 Tax=Paenibacillus dendrobii TaxID=2691084 RepID=A0A7X3LIQ5_9BACL|nr:hypothetical protein [Paenibacillus dendrobii]MWV44828.1 hypothetical protein [Paenibacillus dendrobii]